MELITRRRMGLILGLALGLGYSLSSNLINKINLPNIPLIVPWPGTVGLIIISTLMFGALGLIATWTEESLPGVLAAALVGSVLSSIWTELRVHRDSARPLRQSAKHSAAQGRRHDSKARQLSCRSAVLIQ